ncbi:TATA box-binding protein-like 2, partial [Plectropomus leopardus]|uniref:TATA box-binding protein-like 2 n=1 Tax=Plectropomus leopardus TaxID=160734 RepID=UPI001C4CFCDB
DIRGLAGSSVGDPPLAAAGSDCSGFSDKFNPLIMRIREPRTTALIYSSGKLVCTGATSAQQSRQAARKFARKVQKLGFPVRFLNFKIHNIFAYCETFPVNLMELASHQSCSYEPEMFPAGVFFRGIPDITVVIAQSGKISLTGTKDEAKIYKAVDTIWPILQRFRRS